MAKRTRSMCHLFATICWSLLIAAGSIGCKGNPGAAGSDGTLARDQGTITGLLTISGTTTPAVAAKVVANPGNFATVSGNDGSYSLQLTVGVYALTFGAGVNVDGFDPVTVPNVAVVGGGSTTWNASIVQSNPLIVTPNAPLLQVGFGKTVTLGVSVAGAPPGATPAFTWTQTSGPPVAINGASSTAPTFVTRKLGDVIGAHLTNVAVPVRKGAVAIATQHESELSYGFKVTVTAGRFVKSATTLVNSVAVTAGAHAVPLGVNIVLGSPAQSGYQWNIASVPTGSTATLDFSRDQFASLVPDKEGIYTVSESGAGR